MYGREFVCRSDEEGSNNNIDDSLNQNLIMYLELKNMATVVLYIRISIIMKIISKNK